jgi:25S rRNA (cytosine2870-C5)-methyltransferase
VRVTAKNIEKRSRALEKKARMDVERDEEERLAAEAADGDATDMDVDEGLEGFHLPTVEEREEEAKGGGADLVTIQSRMKACARILSNFNKLRAPGR